MAYTYGDKLDVANAVGLACDLLVAGVDTPATVEVAGLSSSTPPVHPDVAPLVVAMLAELGMRMPVNGGTDRELEARKTRLGDVFSCYNSGWYWLLDPPRLLDPYEQRTVAISQAAARSDALFDWVNLIPDQPVFCLLELAPGMPAKHYARRTKSGGSNIVIRRPNTEYLGGDSLHFGKLADRDYFQFFEMARVKWQLPPVPRLDVPPVQNVDAWRWTTLWLES